MPGIVGVMENLTLSAVASAFYNFEDRSAFPKALREVYGEDVAAFVEGEIAKVWGEDADYECVDSNRFAVVGNAADEARYEDAVTCCGQADFEFNHPSGVSFRYGFNYGH